ncbi:hypothetical protein J6I39_01525 [bacterium]|nr:hypothetical protein [bacterium]
MAEEMNQNCDCAENNCQCEEQNCQCDSKDCAKECSVRGYDVLALIFCICPIAVSIFRIDYQNPDNMLQLAFKMLVFLAFPFISAVLSLKKSDKCRTFGPIVFATVFILAVVYAVIMFLGISDGGKLF